MSWLSACSSHVACRLGPQQYLAMHGAGASACILPRVRQWLALDGAEVYACRHADRATRRSRDARTWHARHPRPPAAPRRHQEGCNPSLAARRGGSADKQTSCPCQQAWCAQRHACCMEYLLHVNCPATTKELPGLKDTHKYQYRAHIDGLNNFSVPCLQSDLQVTLCVWAPEQDVWGLDCKAQACPERCCPAALQAADASQRAAVPPLSTHLAFTSGFALAAAKGDESDEGAATRAQQQQEQQAPTNEPEQQQGGSR